MSHVSLRVLLGKCKHIQLDIPIYLEPETSMCKWLFQLDDSKS